MRGHVGGVHIGVLTLPWMHHDADVVYIGPLPRLAVLPSVVSAFSPELRFQSYVYVLGDGVEGVLYVGKARRPWRRLLSHQRRDWWPDVETLTLFRVESDVSQYAADRLALALERDLIQSAEPEFNIAQVVA